MPSLSHTYRRERNLNSVPNSPVAGHVVWDKGGKEEVSLAELPKGKHSATCTTSAVVARFPFYRWESRK